jgi:nicotinic acid mononucleotide adenylyltransferase
MPKTSRRKTSSSSSSSKNNVIFSFQGSFGPPTFGHLMSMYNFAKQIQKDYSGNKKLLFMPAAGGSKTHLFPTRESRTNVLRVFCQILKSLFPDIDFDVSDIEYNIAGSANRSVGTIHTIRKLVELKTNDSDEIALGMGRDNAYQLPYWESIDEYAQHVSKIYVVHRDPTPTEMQNIRLFQVTNADAKKTKTKMYFDITVPSWTKAPFTKFFIDPMNRPTISASDPNRQAVLLENLTPTGKDMYKFYGTLPAIVEVKCKSIPPTSSSMLRYFIGQVLKNELASSSVVDNLNREKVKNIMFGRDIHDQDAAVDETIASYVGTNHPIPQNDDPLSKNEPSYEDQYLAALPHLKFSQSKSTLKRKRS